TIPSPVSEAIYFLSGWANLWLLGVVFSSIVFLFLFSANLYNLRSGCSQKVLV
ncbi:hypothetical protein N312_11485, partial [Balearica regulorum gibbericeps]